MRHVTAWALAVLRVGVPDARFVPPDDCVGSSTGCGAEYDGNRDFLVTHANALIENDACDAGYVASALPDCPRCRVLLDAALEGRDLRAVLAGATP